MFLFLILPVLVSGFISCNSDTRYYYKLHRYEGQYLYLKSAHLGLYNLFWAALIAFSLSEILPSSYTLCDKVIPLDFIELIDGYLERAFPDKWHDQIHSFSWVLALSVWTIMFAYLSAWLSNSSLAFKLSSKAKARVFLMGKVLRDSPIDYLFFQSYISSKPLLLTLENGKVYVGTISELGEPNESEGMDQEISIIPIMSGYRTEKKSKVKFVTEYEIVDSDLNVVIRQDKIITASWFDFDVYKKLNP